MLSKNEIKFLRTFHQKKFRDREQKLLVEGERIIHDLLHRHKNTVENVYVSRGFKGDLSFSEDIHVIELERQVFEQLSASKNPQGIMALIAYPEFCFQDVPCILVLDGIQDPGNMGTILRTAAWFGIDQIVCSNDTVDVCNPKVVQSSMGSVYDLNICYDDLASFLVKQKKPIYGAILGGTSIYQIKMEQPGILVLGNEGNGISESIKNHINHAVLIPKIGFGESLNVASATAIFLSEWNRVGK